MALADILRSDEHSGVDPWEVESVLSAVPDGWAKIDGEWIQLREVQSDSLLVTAWCER